MLINLKTSLALYLNSSIFYTYLIFGIIEGIWDIKTNIRGLKPGILGLLTHSFFGGITWYLYNLTGYVSLGIIVSISAISGGTVILLKEVMKCNTYINYVWRSFGTSTLWLLGKRGG
jgi:hypothetical protein